MTFSVNNDAVRLFLVSSIDVTKANVNLSSNSPRRYYHFGEEEASNRLNKALALLLSPTLEEMEAIDPLASSTLLSAIPVVVLEAMAVVPTSLRLRLPSATPQLLARCANALPAPLTPDVAGPFPAVVDAVRRRLRRIFDMPSEAEPSGEGVPKSPLAGDEEDAPVREAAAAR